MSKQKSKKNPAKLAFGGLAVLIVSGLAVALIASRKSSMSSALSNGLLIALWLISLIAFIVMTVGFTKMMIRFTKGM